MVDQGTDLAERVEVMRGGFAPPQTKTVAIVGSHSATRELAPYDDPTCEIWLFNEAAQKPEVYKRWDALLQIHAEAVYTSPENWVNAEHWDWLQEDHGKPIWMQEIDPRVPNSRKYPLDEILAMLPGGVWLSHENRLEQWRYLRSSPAMALALAIYLGYEHILLYGSELSSNTEYTYQASNYAFWIGVALGRGINVEMRCWENEFIQRIYGYEGELELDKDYFRGRVEELAYAWKNNESILKKLKDRIGQAMLENKYELVGKLSLEIEAVASASGETSGALSEAERYMKRENPISRQEFERVAAKAQTAYNQMLQEMYHMGGKCEYVWNVWMQHGKIDALNQLRYFLGEKTKQAYDCGARKGIFSENMTYLAEYDERLTAAGGVRALGRNKIVEPEV